MHHMISVLKFPLLIIPMENFCTLMVSISEWVDLLQSEDADTLKSMDTSVYGSDFEANDAEPETNQNPRIDPQPG